MNYLTKAIALLTLASSAHAKPLTEADIQAITEKTTQAIQAAVKKALAEAKASETPTSPDKSENFPVKPADKSQDKTQQKTLPKAVRSQKHLNAILEAEKLAKPAAQKVLAMARKMTIDEQAILPGGCWNYVDAVFTHAGFPRKVRKHVFNGKYPKGPFVDVDTIREGDWLYIVNHSYHDIDHSSLFIAWTDKAKKQGLMLSYAGEKRKEPARYRVYDLSHVYKIVRVE